MAKKAKRRYLWVTLGFFLITLVGHWGFAWSAYVQEQAEHGEPVEFQGYFAETMRDTLENWQSEFLQLMWQVAGLSVLWYVGSPEGKPGDDRKEEKLDAILRKVDPQNAERILKDLESEYPKK